MTLQTCNIPPFRYQSVPQPNAEQSATSNQINEQAVEAYLARLLEAVCNDLTALDQRISDLETP